MFIGVALGIGAATGVGVGVGAEVGVAVGSGVAVGDRVGVAVGAVVGVGTGVGDGAVVGKDSGAGVGDGDGVEVGLAGVGVDDVTLVQAEAAITSAVAATTDSKLRVLTSFPMALEPEILATVGIYDYRHRSASLRI